jgi:hypothetical protein
MPPFGELRLGLDVGVVRNSAGDLEAPQHFEPPEQRNEL